MMTLFDTMHAHFSSAADNSMLEEFLASIPQVPQRSWPHVLPHKINEMLALMSNSSAPGPDHITWHHLKQILSHDQVANDVCLMFNNVCSSGTWPSWFKDSISIIIPKPKKPDYSVPKAYRPIALLNMLSKLLTKIIAHHMQHNAASHSLLHPGQCGGVQKHATIDAGLALLDFINTNRERGWHMSACAVDIAQFFPSLNHHAAGIILAKLGFPKILVNLIESYFADRTTSYQWDTAMSQPYNFSLGMPQGDCLSPILSALYLSVAIKSVFPISFPPKRTRCPFFVNDGVLYTVSPSLTTNVQTLSRYILQLLTALDAIGLHIEPSKTELIHFFAFQLGASSRSLAVEHQPHLTFHWGGCPYDIKPSKIW